jgi:hypothetical protein
MKATWQEDYPSCLLKLNSIFAGLLKNSQITDKEILGRGNWWTSNQWFLWS